jgi:hypothetical protein
MKARSWWRTTVHNPVQGYTFAIHKMIRIKSVPGTRITIYGSSAAPDPPCTLLTSLDNATVANTTTYQDLPPDTISCNVTFFRSQKVYYDEDHVLNVTVGTNGNPESGRAFNFHRVEVEEDTTYLATPLPTTTSTISQPTSSPSSSSTTSSSTATSSDPSSNTSTTSQAAPDGGGRFVQVSSCLQHLI